LNPLDRDGRFQLVFTVIPLPCSPDATTLRFTLDAGSLVKSRTCPELVAEKARDHGEACGHGIGAYIRHVLRNRTSVHEARGHVPACASLREQIGPCVTPSTPTRITSSPW
jgi:hypothetical protein